MIRLHRSNRADRLLDELASLVSSPLPDPFLRETIVVQGKGMERWLSLELARRLGVWANPWFPFPRTLLAEAIRSALGEEAARRGAAFEPEALLWKIAQALPLLSARPELESIRAYLAGDEGGVRRLRLAAEIAAVFDRYVLYRPHLVAAWERGENRGAEPWQPVLWRELVGSGSSPPHLAATIAALIERLSAAGPKDGLLAPLPPRLSIFGVSSLPPLYLRAFDALSRVLEVHLFLLAPSREYMGGTVSAKEAARLRRRGRQAAGQLELDFDLHLEPGHPLVASLGTLGKELQELLEEIGYSEGEDDLFVDPAADPRDESALAVLQSDLLNLVARREGGTAEPVSPRPDDDSIQIHWCHSPMREVEVLHDRLLALFDADPSLRPHDVVVLAPSIDEYAPYVEAVFGADRSRPPIPFHVADRGPRIAERVVDAFFRVLEVLRGRLTAPEVFDLLAMDVVRARFGIAARDLETIRGWIASAGIRWGIDAAHRQAAGQLPFRENTWEFGLDRLLLGLALPGRALYAGVLPFDGVEGTDADLLGRLAAFCDALFGFRELFDRPRPPAEWETALGRLVGSLVEVSGDDADQHRRIRRALETLTARAAAAGFEGDLHLDAYRRELEKEIAGSAAPHGFLSTGVTFCAMVPMRAIPFRVVCLLGMTDAGFPRSVRPPAFDATARRREKGDRTRRDDDRYLFLEVLLSARDTLLVTTVGQSIQTNAPLPPSVVVSELLDVLADSFRGPDGTDDDPLARRRRVVDRFVVRHPLQAFSPRYFDRGDGRLFSYSTAALEGARAERRTHARPPPFVTAPLPAEENQGAAVDLEELERFLEHPSRWFCQRRLGLFLGRDPGTLDDREPLEPDALEAWAIGDVCLSRLLAGETAEEALSALFASGSLPPGALGRSLYERIAPTAGRLAREARALVGSAERRPLEVDLETGGVRLTGFLPGVFPRGQIDWRYSKLGGRHELRFWLRHLLLQIVAPEALPRETFLVGRADEEGGPVVARFRPLPSRDDAAGALAGLVASWREALRVPLPLFPECSRAYARALRTAREGDAAERALAAAREAFRRSTKDGAEIGDCRDEYVVRLFGPDPLADDATLPGSDRPLLPAFREVAERVFAPLLAHREPAR